MNGHVLEHTRAQLELDLGYEPSLSDVVVVPSQQRPKHQLVGGPTTRDGKGDKP